MLYAGSSFPDPSFFSPAFLFYADAFVTNFTEAELQSTMHEHGTRRVTMRSLTETSRTMTDDGWPVTDDRRCIGCHSSGFGVP
ncbi:hypothetical protein EVAR_19748_1 [Eumeta japonica]|uniref:Uncharacterized protein n=1 Tax=Eumeta variegata TaxID=151549 RepID=A0A4C1URR4_EUMVA|nr:hypothetical protein EVAR_19748_1 [Eumeta japonica]